MCVLQEEQLHRKATELRALEEERFTTEHRRKAARDIFEQEKALKEAVAGRRRQLVAAKVIFGEIMSISVPPMRCAVSNEQKRLVF